MVRTEPTLKCSKASNIITTPSNLERHTTKKFLYKCLKNTDTVCVFYYLPSVNNVHAEISLFSKRQYKTNQQE